MAYEIDVVIPIIKKDLEVLKLTLASIRKNLKHSIGNIFLVSPAIACIKKFAEDYSCIFINEKEVVDIELSEINYINNNTDRSGWLYQQLLKLNIDKFSDKKFVFVCDADTLFVRPVSFIENDKVLFETRALKESEDVYIEVAKKLLGTTISYDKSYVVHHMMICIKTLKDFKAYIERIFSTDFNKAILENYKKDDWQGFSEYMTYAYYNKINNQEGIYEEDWGNLMIRNWDDSLRQKDLCWFEKKYSEEFKTVSLQHYCRAKVKSKSSFIRFFFNR